MDALTPDSAETDRLLQLVQAGDRQAFERLYALHRPFLRQVVNLRLDARLRARVDPPDVVPETQLEAFRRLAGYLERQPMPFRLWLRQTAFERLLKIPRQHLETARRALGREVALPDRSSPLLAQQLLAAGSTPSRQVSREELARRVRQAVAQLPEADRGILLMRNFEGRSNAEVGCILHLDPATVSKRHGRALLRLQSLLVAGGLTESEL